MRVFDDIRVSIICLSNKLTRFRTQISYQAADFVVKASFSGQKDWIYKENAKVVPDWKSSR